MSEIAILVYPQKFKKTGRAKNNFEWRGNFGILLLKDVLERAGYRVSFCSVESAWRFNIILVSLISIWDVYNFVDATTQFKQWKQRRNIVIIGGWGLRNAAPVRNCADYAVFGRGESIIVSLVQDILNNKDIQTYPSVMALKDFPQSVTFCQADRLYPHKIIAKPISYQEFSLGCPRRCWFCIYSHTRKWLKDGGDPYYETSTKFHMSKELILTDIKIVWDGKSVNLRTSVDGWSERLRFAFNKQIKDSDFIIAVEAASLTARSSPIHINTYMITGYPTERDEERLQFLSMLKMAKVRGAKIVLKLILVPFRPAPITPSQWLPADIHTNWRSVAREAEILRSDRYDVSYFTRAIESPWSLLQSLIIERATEESDSIINTICFSKALRRLCAKGKVDALSDKYDLSQYVKEYDIDNDKLPTWYLSSFSQNDVIASEGKELKRRLGM